MRWRPPAHPCPVAISFFITVFIACRRGGLGGRFHVYGWAFCWYVICVTDCGIRNVIAAIYVHMCMFVVRCICVGGWAQTKVALCLYFCRHGLSSLRVSSWAGQWANDKGSTLSLLPTMPAPQLPHSAFTSCGGGYLNSGSPACTVDALTTELCPARCLLPLIQEVTKNLNTYIKKVKWKINDMSVNL